MAVVTVAFEDLDTWLQAQPDNTADTPYELNITGLTSQNISESSTRGSLGYILNNNNTKYVDLYETILPSKSSYSSTFLNCTTLVGTPDFQSRSGYNSLSSMFNGCTSLIRCHAIPDCVTSMNYTFRGCTSLTVAPSFSTENKNVSLTNTFLDCTSLVDASNIVITSKDQNGSDIQNMFKGCTSLVNPPVLLSVYRINNAFENCTSLVNAPILPDNVGYTCDAFKGCTSLVNPPLLPDSVYDMRNTFEDCINLAYKVELPGSDPNLKTDCYKNVPQTAYGLINTSFDSTVRSYDYRKGNLVPLLEISKNTEDNCFEQTGRVAYSVHINYLQGLLASLDENTIDTPYELHVFEYSTYLAIVLKSHDNKYVDLRLTNINGNVDNFLKDCTTVIYSPNINEGPTSMAYWFSGCTNLKQCMPLPSTVTNMEGTFSDCLSLTVSPAIPNNVTDMDGTFSGCSNLESAPAIPNTVTSMEATFNGCSKITTAPTLPNGITSLYETFNECTSLITPPTVPSGVTNMSYSFNGCTSLSQAPNIPSGVTNLSNAFVGCSFSQVSSVPYSITNMDYAFKNCENMETIVLVPAVTTAKECFKGCASLTKIDEFLIPLSTLRNNANYQNMFEGCNSLIEIGYKVTESSSWHAFRVKFNANTIEGRIYDTAGNYVEINNGTAVSVTKSALALPVKSDELWFPDMTQIDFNTDAKINAVIERLLQYKYTWFKKIVLPPDNKSFVMWAYDKDNFVTNIDMGGGSPVDVVQSGNMNPVTSNAVAGAIENVIYDSSITDCNVVYETGKIKTWWIPDTASNVPNSNTSWYILAQCNPTSVSSNKYVTQIATCGDNKSINDMYIRHAYKRGNDIVWTAWNKITIDTELNTVVGGHFFRLPSPIGNVRYAKIKIKNYNKSADSVFIAFNCYSMWGVIRENHQCFYRGTLYGIQGISYTPYSSDNDDFFWIKWASYRTVEFVSSKELELVELTATAPSGITFTAPVQWT